MDYAKVHLLSYPAVRVNTYDYLLKDVALIDDESVSAVELESAAGVQLSIQVVVSFLIGDHQWE